MDIYITRGEEHNGPYSVDFIRQLLADGELDGTELAWREGLNGWVNVKELLQEEPPKEEPPEASPVIPVDMMKPPTQLEASPSPVEEPPEEGKNSLSEDDHEQIRMIKDEITNGNPEAAWQLIEKHNNPHIYEGLLEDCPVDENGWVTVPIYLSENGNLFIKLLASLPETAQVQPELKPLTMAGFENCQMSDVTALAELKQLTMLGLAINQISDLSPLAEQTQIRWLDAYDNQISDASPLAKLTQLTWLRLTANQFTDVSSLKGLTQLKQLFLSFNQITDLSPLAGLTQLINLDLWENQITDVSALEGLDQLEKLFLGNNQISDVSGLSKLKGLKALHLKDNPSLTKAQIDELQKTLPECEIVHNATK